MQWICVQHAPLLSKFPFEIRCDAAHWPLICSKSGKHNWLRKEEESTKSIPGSSSMTPTAFISYTSPHTSTVLGAPTSTEVFTYTWTGTSCYSTKQNVTWHGNCFHFISLFLFPSQSGSYSCSLHSALFWQLSVSPSIHIRGGFRRGNSRPSMTSLSPSTLSSSSASAGSFRHQEGAVTLRASSECPSPSTFNSCCPTEKSIFAIDDVSITNRYQNHFITQPY